MTPSDATLEKLMDDLVKRAKAEADRNYNSTSRTEGTDRLAAARNAVREYVSARTLTEHEWAVVRIAATRFAQDMEQQGYFDPAMNSVLNTLRDKAAR